MAAFRKFLSSKTNRIKPPKSNLEHPEAVAVVIDEDEDVFHKREAAWQEELDEMSEFLVLKSTDEQREDGASQVVDTAYIEDIDGTPVIKAVFDIHLFKPEEIDIQLHDNTLVVYARTTVDKDVAVYRKTMLRQLKLPENADATQMACDKSREGLLAITIPIKRTSEGSNSTPPPKGHHDDRAIRMTFPFGPGLSSDDLKVEIRDHKLLISAHYNTCSGRRDETLEKECCLPKHVDVDFLHHTLSADGTLYIDISLKDEYSYKCEVTTQDVTDEMSTS